MTQTSSRIGLSATNVAATGPALYNAMKVDTLSFKIAIVGGGSYTSTPTMEA